MSSVFQAAGGRIATPPATDEYGLTAQRSVMTEEERERQRLQAKWDRSRVRRDRFLVARTRTIGIDMEAIEKQKAEKAAREKALKDEEMAYAAEQERIRRAIARFEADAAKKKSAEQAAINAALAEAKAQADRRAAAALNDPHALKKDRPARDGDDDPRCGPASLQRFDGEDPLAPERERLQAMQMREWVKQSTAEREEALLAEKEADREYAAYLDAVGKMRDEVEAAVEREAREARLAMTAENERMARERREKAEREKMDHERFNEKELTTTLKSGILAENPADGTSRLGPHRKRPDHYRGLSEEERLAWLEENRRQREEQAKRGEEEKLADREYAAATTAAVRNARRVEVDIARRREEERLQMLADLEQQAREQRERSEREASERKNATIGRGFYDYFGQSDR